ncbi:MAG: response regulator transcription factor [Sedimentisphaerales bacterium]|nr:response regulator transcription factor [Sedimentisphaerales bacterium]
MRPVRVLLDEPAMEKAMILIVDDEEDIIELVQLNLAREGYQTLACTTGEKALQIVESKSPDLVILDLMLPGIDGMEVCRRLKAGPETRQIPVLMLTAKGEEADIVAGLELGADDYVTKPFNAKVLVARVRRLLRSQEAKTEDRGSVRIHDLTIDPARHEVLVRGKRVSLTVTEFNILHLLTAHPGVVFTRYQIVDKVHGSDYLVTDRAVDVQIVGLRRKLGSCGNLIETVRGVGYRIRD